MTNKAARVLVALNVPRSAPAVITFTQNVVQSLQANVHIPNPQPPAATIEAALTELQVAEADASARARGAVATRNAKRTVVVGLLQELETNVQKAADANPDQAPARRGGSCRRGSHVLLPTIQAPMTTQPPRGSVLIVEDDELLARSLTRVLKRAGWDVAWVVDARTALDMAGERAFDVIVSDVHMPGVSGIDLLRELRSARGDVPVILLTGAPTRDGASAAIEANAKYIAKPVPTEVLLRAIERAARLRRVARTNGDG